MSTDPTITTSFITPPGGIMTREAGAISGPVELQMRGRRTFIRYQQADEWYRVAGRIGRQTRSQAITKLATDPGTDPNGNPIPTML